MNSSVYRFSLDIQSAQSQISIPVLLGDTGRTFRINLSDGATPYTIADGCLAKLSIKRPTGTHLEEFCSIEGNSTIVYSFSQNKNTAAVEGIHECDITLYGLDGSIITTARFTMVVNERVIKSDDIVVTDEDRSYIDAVMAEEVKRQDAEAKRKDAETRRESSTHETIPVLVHNGVDAPDFSKLELYFIVRVYRENGTRYSGHQRLEINPMQVTGETKSVFNTVHFFRDGTSRIDREQLRVVNKMSDHSVRVFFQYYNGDTMVETVASGANKNIYLTKDMDYVVVESY